MICFIIYARLVTNIKKESKNNINPKYYCYITSNQSINERNEINVILRGEFDEKVIWRVINLMAKSSKVFVFFNCDENKSESSMNIFYNRAIYKDGKTSRKNLWKKVKEESELNRVKIAEENFKSVENLILEGDPTEASKFIQFGAIKVFDCY